MKGEYKFNGDVLNDRFVFDNKKVDSSLSFHSGFSRWQVIILPFKVSKCLAFGTSYLFTSFYVFCFWFLGER